MGRVWKLVLGALTVWPLAWMPLAVGAMLVMVLRARNATPEANPPGERAQAILDTFARFQEGTLVIFAVTVLTTLLGLGLFIYYLVHVLRSERVAQERKALWALGFFVGGPFAMPLYWYLYVWREPAVPAPPLSR